jgi:hypothetical protein
MDSILVSLFDSEWKRTWILTWMEDNTLHTSSLCTLTTLGKQ